MHELYYKNHYFNQLILFYLMNHYSEITKTFKLNNLTQKVYYCFIY